MLGPAIIGTKLTRLKRFLEMPAPWCKDHGAEGSRLIWGRDESAESQFDLVGIESLQAFVCHAIARRLRLCRLPVVESEHDGRFNPVRNPEFGKAPPDQRIDGMCGYAQRQCNFLV